MVHILAQCGEEYQPRFGERRTKSFLPTIPAMGNRLRELRLEKGWTHDQAAEHMGVSRGQFIKLERGERRLNTNYIDMAAKAFGVSPALIISEFSSNPPLPTRQVPLKGYIGAGGEIEAVDGGNLGTVEAPAEAHPDTVAGEVKGLSMLPVYENGTLVYWSATLPPEELVNRRCVAQLADGRIMVKVLKKGSSDGLWTLVSINPAYPDIEDVPVEWVAKIDWTKPPY